MRDPKRQPIVQLQGISKRFGALIANDQVSLDIAPGEVLALLGENGAGKSTLMKILYGFYQADAGSILIEGQPVTIDSPHTAMRLGIAMVFQQFSLIENLTVAENLMLASAKAPRGVWVNRTHWVKSHSRLSELAPSIQPTNLIRNLAVGEKQLVELVKALDADARVVILDEPTSVLTPIETQRFWMLIRQLADQGHAVVFITHKLEDVRACADCTAVMRKGRVVDMSPARDRTAKELVYMMVGRENLAIVNPVPPSPAYPRLQIQNLSADSDASSRSSASTIRNVNLAIAAGEIVGIAGVAGNGQQLFADVLAGLLPSVQGTMLLDGTLLHRAGKSSRQDIAYIPEQPLQNGVAAELDLVANLWAKKIGKMAFFPLRAKQRTHAAHLIHAFDVQPPDPTLKAVNLSGGNLQKLVLARELSDSPSLIIACYPTMGLDIAATQFVYEKLFQHAQSRACIVWISESLDDLLQYSHRIAVLFRGEVVGVVETSTANRHQLGQWMTGGREVA